MSTPTCPYCNAAEDPNWAYENAVWFRCGTMIHPDRTNRASQTNQCVEDEVGRLTDQRDQLAARVKELEIQCETLKAERNAAGMRGRNQLLQKVQRLEAVQSAGIALMDAIAPFCLNPDDEGDDEIAIRQCHPDMVIQWEEPPTAAEHMTLHDATFAFSRAVFEAKETKP